MEALLVAAAASAAVGVAFWTYLRREPPVGGRLLLATLRAATFFLLVLLLFNPSLPGDDGPSGPGAPAILLDASLSMAARDSAGGSAWDAALRRAAEGAGPGGEVLLFGTSLRTVSGDSLPDGSPGETGSRLAPALEQAAALGGGAVRVLSDLRLDDPVAAASAAAAGGLDVRFERVGEGVRNAGLGEVEAPAALDPGAEGAVEVALHGTGGGPADSADVELRIGDRLLASRRVELPSGGRSVRQRFDFVAPEEPGAHRLELRATLPDDGFTPDDVRVIYVDVEEEREGLLVLSLQPDWEPRYLLPVLEQVTGLRGRGFLRLAGERWLPMAGGEGEAPRGPVDAATVQEAVEGAELLVVHGLDADAPGWVGEATRSARRLVALPASAAGAQLLGVTVARWSEGEWYADPELPTSPLAGELAGVDLEGLPPLAGVLPLAAATPEARTPLLVRPGSGEEREAALLLLPSEDGRTVVGLAAGFWRWGARDGAPREAYRRLWSAASGWLLRAPVAEGEPEVAPADRPLPRGAPVAWRVRGDVGDSVSIRILDGDTAVTDTAVAAAGDTALRTRSLPPGRYAYTVEAPALPVEGLTGELEIEAYSPEMLRPPTRPEPGEGSTDAVDATADAGRPLRTHPLPYLAVLVLLSAEWIGRRRQGLR